MSKIDPIDPETPARRARLSLLARAPSDALIAHWHAFLGDAAAPEHQILRPPEIGTVMVRGRAGAKGAAFNLGEITMTRCTVQTPDGTVGVGLVQGRSKEGALTAALADALAQGPQANALEAGLFAPLRRAATETRETRAAKAAATKVEFFTMVRGEG